jgi:hypothetical protein
MIVVLPNMCMCEIHAKYATWRVISQWTSPVPVEKRGGQEFHKSSSFYAYVYVENSLWAGNYIAIVKK